MAEGDGTTRLAQADMQRWKIAILLILVLAVHNASSPIRSRRPDAHQTPGLQLFTEQVDFGSGPAVVHVLRVDLQKSRLMPALAADGVAGRETVLETARRHGALAAVNGDYWRGGQPGQQGDPAGMYLEEGDLISRPITRISRGLVAATAGKVSITQGITAFSVDLILAGRRVSVPVNSVEINSVDKINPSGSINELAIFTPAYGGPIPVQRGTVLLQSINLLPDGKLHPNQTYTGMVDTLLPSDQPFRVPPHGLVLALYAGGQKRLATAAKRPGARISLTVRLPAQVGQWDWACSGYPMLVQNGRAATFAGWRDPGVINAHPRTAIGVDASGQHAFLITVDGRYPGRKPGGATLRALAGYLVHRWHIDTALNLDGGGSTTMVVQKSGQYQVVNRPSDGSLRPVAQSLLVF